MIWRAVIALMFLATAAFADSHETPTDPDVDDFIAKRVADSLGPPEVAQGIVLDEALEERFKAALSEYYRYHETGFAHRRAVFEWQLLSSKIIFVVVIGVVALGVYFSWLQFMARRRDGEGTEEGEASSVELSVKGIKVTSPVLGVVILAISLAFFYLYLLHVYPIEELF